MLKIFEFGFIFTFLHDGSECSEDYKCMIVALCMIVHFRVLPRRCVL